MAPRRFEPGGIMLALLLWISATLVEAGTAGPPHWWDARVDASLDRAPDRRADWQRVLENTSPAHRAAMAYLLTYLPLRDLEKRPPDALAANVALACQVR